MLMLMGVLMILMFLADIGTATNQWDDKNRLDGPDVCQGNVVTDNFIDTQVYRCLLAFLVGYGT